MKQYILERMRKIVAILLLVMGIIGLTVALRTLKIGTFAKPQGGFAPMLFSVLLIIFSVINIICEFLKPNSIPGDLGDVNWVKFFLYIAICIVYVALIKLLGFATDTFICLTLMLKLAGLKGKARPVLYSLVFSALIWALFTFAMDVPLPRGFLI
ncbi:MAG: tripartite tricarboxylate transporter TctB family protein [Spirochaetales bacterium]|nr:tripartite tricarboxylate transporter TctB family protein [Spirochaetales bacterium]